VTRPPMPICASHEMGCPTSRRRCETWDSSQQLIGSGATLRGQPRLSLHVLTNPVPACGNPVAFLVSHFEICGYSEEAQRFLATTDLN